MNYYHAQVGLCPGFGAGRAPRPTMQQASLFVAGRVRGGRDHIREAHDLPEEATLENQLDVVLSPAVELEVHELRAAIKARDAKVAHLPSPARAPP